MLPCVQEASPSTSSTVFHSPASTFTSLPFSSASFAAVGRRTPNKRITESSSQLPLKRLRLSEERKEDGETAIQATSSNPEDPGDARANEDDDCDADTDDSEDSNDENYWKNDYPDEEDDENGEGEEESDEDNLMMRLGKMGLADGNGSDTYDEDEEDGWKRD